MKPRDTLLIIAGGVLLLLIAVYASRIAQHYPALRAETGRVKLTHLEASTRTSLASLENDVLITYYVSGRENMPSHMRRLERNVVDLLDAMKRASGGRLDYQLIDPESDPEFTEYAAHQRVAPFRVRSVARDSYSETTVWSTLHISFGSYRPAVINGVSPEHLPRLQAIIVGQLEQMQNPREPVFAIDSPVQYRGLENHLRQFGRVMRLSLHDGEPIPPEVDVLFWMDPGDVRPDMVRRVSRFVESGRSAVVAGSRHFVEVQRDRQGQSFVLRETTYDAEALLSAFGLRPLNLLVLDEFSQQVPGEIAPRQAKFFIRCIAPNQDFRTMQSAVNGHLLFSAPTPFALEGDVLAARGFNPTILATTSDRTEVRDVVYGEIDLNLAQWFEGDPAPKLPLMVWLRPNEPWRGSIIFCASNSLFRDGTFLHENFAHRRLIEVLTETLASDERLVMARAGIHQAQPLPELSGTARLFWRVVCIGLIPVVLAGLAFKRRVFRLDQDRPRDRLWNWRGLPTRIAAGFVAVIALVWVGVALGWRADLTDDRINRLAPMTERLAKAARGEQAADMTIYFSRHDLQPPEMRPMLRKLRSTLRDLQRAGAQLNVRWIHPEDLDAPDREQLQRDGVRPVRMVTRDEEVTTVRTVYSSLRLESQGRTEWLHFPDRASFEHLEFRLAFALWRLQTGRRPHIAFVADIPRLSAAEVYHDFQQRNLMAPTGTDVYSEAREVLEKHDFRVTHVSPRSEIPADVDAVIWMQPRRDMLPMLDQVVRKLHEGIPVMIASQHFYMQARQYRGTGFETVYWPQPQVTDLHMHYFPDLGIELVHEVPFDDLKGSLELLTHVNREADRRDYDQQDSALPFLIRAVAANFNREHPITRGLGDQLLPFATYLKLDRQRMEELGLRATTLFTTSERSWTYKWTGGWLPEAYLQGPPRDEDGNPQFAGRLPLAVLFEGPFPLPEDALTTRQVTDSFAVDLAEDVGAHDGRLLLVGGSYLFRNERIGDADFRADHLLLNAASSLALERDLAEVAGHRRVARGFDYLSYEDRLRWRAIVVVAGPVAMLVFALGWTAFRRRPPRLELEVELGADGATEEDR